MPSGRRRQLIGEQPGTPVLEAEPDCFFCRSVLADGHSFGIVEIQDRPVCFADKIAEQPPQLVDRLVVFGDVGQHRDRRFEQGDRAIALVNFADKYLARPDQCAGEGIAGVGEILHHRAVHDRRVAPGPVQDPGGHAGDRGFSAGPRDADAVRGGIEQIGQHGGPAHAPGAGRPGRNDIRHSVLHSGGGDKNLLRTRDPAAVLRVQPDATPAQIVELGAGAAPVECRVECRVERTVRPFHPMALGL